MSEPDENDDRRFPIVTTMLCVVNLAWWALMVARGVSPSAPTNEQLLHWGASYAPPIVYDHAWWRLLSAPFVHLAYWHVGLNMATLAFFGPWVERAFGSKRYAALYFACALSGSLVSVVVNPNRISVGASGAIFGLFAAAFALRWLSPDLVSRWSPRAQRSINGTLIMLLGFAFVPGVDNAAHVGGAVAGFVVAYALLRGRVGLGAVALTTLWICAAFLIAPRVRSNPAIVGWEAAKEAEKLIAAGKPRDALRVLEAIPSEAQEQRDVLMQRTYAYDALQDPVHEVVTASKLLEVEPGSMSGFLYRCRGRYGTKDWAGALADCAQADASPKANAALHATVRGMRAAIAAQRNDGPGMRKELDAMLAETPNNGLLYATRATADVWSDDLADAAKDYARAAQLGVTVAKLGGGPCRVASRLGRADADAICDAAVSASPSSVEVCVARAEHDDLTQRYDRAIAEIERCRAISQPDAAHVMWNDRAWYELHAGKLADASRDIERAIELAPQSTAALGTKCFIEEKLGLHDDALADCTRAAAADATDVYDRAMVKLLAGDANAAIALWQEVIEKRPWTARELAPYLAQAKRAHRAR